MKVLGIDSGIERTGWAIFEKLPTTSQPTYITSGLIKTSKTSTIAKRLREISELLTSIVKEYSPDIIVIEQLFFFKNQKTVISVAQSQGAVLVLAESFGIPTEFLAPLQIKSIITGYGTADKKSVEKMLSLTLPKVQLGNKIDDEIDAIACGLAYCYMHRFTK